MARSQPRNEAAYRTVYAASRARGNSEAYSKRIASAEARGKTRQQARGHVEREHVVRAQRASVAGRLTESEKRWIKAQKKRVGYDRSSAAGKARFDEAVEEFTNMEPEERWETIVTQRQREKDLTYASIYAPHYGYVLTPLYLSSRSGLR